MQFSISIYLNVKTIKEHFLKFNIYFIWICFSVLGKHTNLF